MLKKDNSRVYFGKDSYLFEVDKEINEEQFNKNMENINGFLNKLNKDIPINALLIPTKGTVLKDKLPLYAPIVDEKALVDKIRASISEDVTIIDLIDLFKEKSNEYIYYRTDHHWTTKGAYYAYEHYLSSMGKKPMKENEFIINKVSNNFFGTSYRKANFYMGAPDDIHVYIPKKATKYDMIINNIIKTDSIYDESFLDKTDKYSYFLGGDKALVEINTSIKNGKNIAIIKDSFADSFVPFLVNHYEKVILIDTRYFGMSIVDFIQEYEIDEMLFLFNIQNFSQEKSFNLFNR